MNAAKRRAIAFSHRVMSGVMAFVFATSMTFSGASFSFAAEAPTPATSVAAAGTATPAASPAKDTSPTVVRELESSRTADTSTYLLSDGTFRVESYSGPIHYKDGGGSWKDIDVSLVPTETFGVTHTKASGYDETFSTDDVTATPVTVTHGDWSMGSKLLGAEQSDQFSLAGEATYPLAMTDTKLQYRASAQSLKDTLVLSSKKAPDTFTFFVSLKNLSLYTDPAGGYALLDSHGKRAGTIEPLAVFDSSALASPAPLPDTSVCASATMTAVTVPGGAYVTYHVPRAWLDDPARVFPVSVDPTWSYANTYDTSVSQNYGGNSYGSETSLYTGWVTNPAYRHTVRSLIKFHDLGIPDGVTITNAVLQLYCLSNSSNGGKTVYAHAVTGADWDTSQYWDETFTRDSAPFLSKAPFSYTTDDHASIALSGTGYQFWSVVNMVQHWYDGQRPNKGMLLMENADDTSADTYRQYASANNTLNSRYYTPHIAIDYTLPSISGATFDKTSYKPGDTVAATVDVVTKKHPTNVEMTVKSGSTVRGHLVYTYDEDGDHFALDPSPGGGYVAGAIALDPANCSASYAGTSCAVHFSYRIGDTYGDVQNNHLWASDSDSGWGLSTPADTGATYSVLPAATSPASVTTTASATWWNESAGNDDSATAGRGSARLTWPAAASASGYRVYLFDGNAYRNVATTTATTWSSAGQRLYPSDTAISALASGTTANPFVANGLDLRDDPRALYAKTAGTAWDTMPAYAFKVVPYNSGGTAAVSDNATIAVTLDCRTRHVADEPQHTSAELDPIAGDSAAAELDRGGLSLSATDLDVKTFGPEANLSRTYESASSYSGYFGAPGWRFGFERNLSIDATGATYTDEEGDAHRFRNVEGVYVPPAGLVATLAADTGVPNSAYSIRYKDRSKLYFDTTGRLVAETDNNNQKTAYTWTSSSVTIGAANGQSAVFNQLGGGAASADYATTDGTRHVAYQWDSGVGKATVSFSYAGGAAAQTPTRTVEYTYSGGKVTHVTLKTATHFANLTGDAGWDVAYSAGRLSSVTAPTIDGTHPAVTSVSAPTANGSLTSASLTRNGKVADADTDVVQTWTWNPNGSMASKTNPKAAADATATWNYTYSPTGDQTSEIDPDGHSTRSVYDARGNEVAAIDARGNVTASTYDGYDQLLTSTDPNGCVTTNHYDTAGNVDWTEKLLDKTTGATAHTDFGYGPDGRKSFERQVLYADADGKTHWLNTAFDYTGSTTDDAATETKKGQTQTTAQKAGGTFSDENIALGSSPTSTTPSVSTSSQFDAFGNATRQTDALGNFTTSAYDLEGRVLSSVDASRVLAANHTYDALGHEVSGWQEARGVAIGYHESDADVAGRVTTERTYTTSGGVGTRQLYKTVTHSFDSMGRQTGSDDSMVAASPARSVLDASGNVTKSWAEGLPSDHAADNAYASISAYDAKGRATSSRDPGASAGTTTLYDAAGRESTVTAPDLTVTTSKYDPAGNKVAESVISTSGDVATTRTDYDAGGRAVATYDADGDMTAAAFDLAGRQTSAQGPGAPNSPIVYNALGWTISKTDADGIATTYTYDVTGRVLAETIGAGSAAKTTTSVFDAGGRQLSQTDKDGKTAGSVFDDFGRVVDQTQMNSLGLVKRTQTSCDSLSRTAGTTETPSGVAARFTYPTAAQPGASTIVATTYGALTTTLTVDSAGNDLTRQTSGPGVTFIRSVTATDAAGRVIAWNMGAFSQSRHFDSSGHVDTQNGSAFGSAGATYGYSGDGGRKSSDSLALLTSAGGALNWTYDYSADGRLTTATPAGQTPESFAYDQSGRLTTFTATIDRAGTTASGVLTYDQTTGRLTDRLPAGGGVSLEHFAFDSQGNRSSQTSVTFTYDAQNRLATYARPSVTATYTYDANGQRTRSLVTSGTALTDTAWTYSGLSLLSASSTRTVSSAATSTWSVTYLYDGEGRAYAGVYASDATSATVFGLVTTDRGDVVALTDANGTPFVSYRYDAFGRDLGTLAPGGGSVNATTAAAIASRQPLRYAGYVYDAESALYYLSARHYDPATFQFLQKDPAKADGEESAYQYCGGDPTENTDPSGMSSTYVNPMIKMDRAKDSVCWVEACYWVLHQRGVYTIKLKQPKTGKKYHNRLAIYRLIFPNGPPFSRGTYPDKMKEVLRHWGLDAHWCAWAPGFPWVQNNINANRPILACGTLWTKNESDGHVVVIQGWDVDSTGRKWVCIADTFNGKGHKVTYRDITSSNGAEIWNKKQKTGRRYKWQMTTYLN
jgi:RHS repeat-associated protein